VHGYRGVSNSQTCIVVSVTTNDIDGTPGKFYSMTLMRPLKAISNSFIILFNYLLLRYLAKPRSKENGYNIFGYFSKMNGQGDAARAFVDDLMKTDEKFVLLDSYEELHRRIPRQEEEKYRKYYLKKFIYRTNIFFVALDLLKIVKYHISFIFKHKYNIVVFWWEFESGFEDRIPILNEFDEVYVFSDFTRDILDSIENRNFKVTKIKYPFLKNWIIEEEPAAIKKKYNLEGRFCFFFNFDYLSGYNRKNPEAILSALAQEFPAEKQIVLVVKTNNSHGFEEKKTRYLSKVKILGLTERVILIEGPLSRNGFMTLLNAMDCYISLHRGEGLGLGILQALALNKPVIATNYGGNTEYMNNPLAFGVPYTLISANDDYGPYMNVKRWAEPDLKTAKNFMREVFSASMASNAGG
jgi:glycosyltransferase involved in cell wall biosynthesis